MSRRRFLLAVLILPAVLCLWVAFIATSAYLQAPRLVAAVDAPFPPSQLPNRHICALLSIQDPTFFRHEGLALDAGKPGHTTITQGIGKSLYFDRFTPGKLRQRKVKLMISAWAFNRRISKETQLRLFLNMAYFGATDDGGEILGFPAAAAAFFGKELRAVSDREFLSLVVMLDGPNRYHVLRHPETNAARVRKMEPWVARACDPRCLSKVLPEPCVSRRPEF